MIDLKIEDVKSFLFDGSIGLEKEALRIYDDGTFSKSAHPFADNKNIVRDFCENQVEINTNVTHSAEEAVAELQKYERQVTEKLSTLEKPELLWPFSNPPYIESDEDIPVAEFKGIHSEKTKYRHHLSRRYGKYKMTFCGIHFNYSFSDKLLKLCCPESYGEDFTAFKNDIYLHLAKNSVTNGWLINVLFSASPLLDGSFLKKGEKGKTDFLSMASVRCSELGYWNHFVPVLDYSSIEAYAGSIEKYIDNGLISSQTELYYPVRLKSKGENNLERLKTEGVDHIEIRNIDLNPFAFGGISLEDLKFLQVFTVYNICTPTEEMAEKRQVTCVQNFKIAASYDLNNSFIMTENGEIENVYTASLQILEKMEVFFFSQNIDVSAVINFQKNKLLNNERYAQKVFDMFSNGFTKKGLQFIKNRI